MENKKRLIDANEPINAFKRYAKNHPNATWNAFGIEEVLNSAQTVDAVEVVHAYWIYGEEERDGNRQAYCSHCFAGDVHATWKKNAVPYCWNCGSKMDGDVWNEISIMENNC